MKNTYFSVKPGAKGSEFYGGGNSQGLSDKRTKYQGTSGKGLRDQVPSDQVPSTNYRTTSVECPGNHPVITLLSPRNHPLLGSDGQVVTDRRGVLADRREVLADRRDVVAMMRQKCMMWKYVACMLMVLVLGIGQAWAVDYSTVFSATFSSFTAGSYTTTGNTQKGVTFNGKSKKAVIVNQESNGKVVFEDNFSETDQCIEISVNLNTACKIIVYHATSGSSMSLKGKLYNSSGTAVVDFASSAWSIANDETSASKELSTSLTAGEYTLKIGPGGSSTRNVITGIEIQTNSSCTAPSSPSISGTTAYTAGEDISLTASATGTTSGTTTYTWYKGANWASASATTPVQAASTSGATFTKASCVVGDAGTYWCNISNGTGCEVQVSQAITVTPAAAPSGPSTSADDPGATGEITFESWTSLSTGKCYWKDGIKCFQYSSGGLGADALNFTSKVDFGYMSVTAGSGWGSYNMSGLVTYAHFALGVSITTPSVVEVVVDNNQSNDLTLAKLFIKKDDVSYGTGYGDGNYTSGTDIKSRATITRVTDNTGRYKISIPVSASDLATTSPYIIKFYSNDWTNPIGFVFESVTVKPVYTVTYNANGKDGGGAAPTDGSSPYVSGSNVTVLGNTNSMTKTDCVFNGWNTKSDGTGTHYDVGDVISSISENITLYAEWVGYATSWNWWESGQSNDGTTFTYITSKNYICSFASSASTAVASWDMDGGEYYRGIKIKTKDHSIAFWVQTGKRVSITFGTRPTKPTFTVGGVDKSSDVGASTNSDSITVTYTTTADTKFYIENETATKTAFTIKSIKIEDDCTAPTSPSISGTTAYTAGQNISLTASATGTSGTTTYTWYKGADWATASATTPVQAASTSGATFTKASCVVGDAGTYWCNISNGTGCEVQVSQAITVAAAVTTHTVTALTSMGTDTYGTVSAASSSVAEGSTTTITATPATGYQVTNWAVSGTGASISPDGASNSNTTTLTMGTEDATVTATFGPKSYTISYKDQGDVAFSGTHETGYPTSHTYGSATALKKATKDNYAFAGWYTSSSCTGDAVTSLGATDYDDDIILYARWVELDLHQPGTYEKPEANGGYGRPLKNKTVSGSAHDYEVYYVKVDSLDGKRDKGCLYAGSKLTISDGYSMFKIGYSADIEVKGDGWVAFKAYKYEGSNGGSCNNDEFKTTKNGKMCWSNYARLNNTHYVRMYIQGYDEFAFIGHDKDTTGNNFVVKIDGVTATPSSSAVYKPNTSRHLTRYSISANKPHFIEVLGNSAQYNSFRGFSLRLPDVTRYTVSATNTDGYGSVDVTSISNVRSGSTIYTSSNTLTVGGTTVTATENSSTAQYSYAFNNWTKSDGTSLPGTVTGAITVRANFTQTPVNYTLAWNANGGDALSGTYTSGSTGYGTAITAPNDPTRDGYTFTGWNSASNGSGDYYTGSMPAANTTYYAQWTKLYASGTYQFDGNLTVGTSPNKTVTTSEVSYDAFRIDNLFFSGSKIQFEGTDGTPQGDGDNYMGWKMKTNNSTIKFFVEYDSDVEVSIGGIGSSSSCKISYTDQSSVDHSNTSISAGTNPSYEVKAGTMVTITFTVDEGNKKSVTLKRIAISETAACTNPSASLSDGAYEVLGTALDLRTLWSSSNTTDGVTFTVTNAGGTSGTIAGDGYSFSASAAGSATIRAVQTSTGAYCDADETATITVTMPTYDVTLNTNGGTVKADNVTSYTYGTGATLPTDVTKSGYLFQGWYDNSGFSGDAVTTIADDATGNKEYWAKWTALSSIPCLDLTELVDDDDYWYGDRIYDGAYYGFTEVGTVDGTGWELGVPQPGEANLLHIGAIGAIKEVKLTIAEVGGGNTGIDYYFGTYGELNYEGDEYTSTGSLSTGTISLRPTGGSNNAFVFKPTGASVKISNICIYYEPSCTDPELGFESPSLTKYTGESVSNTLTNTHNVEVSYSSSNEAVATVNSSGEVTIKGVGTTTITATAAAQTVSAVSYCADAASYTLTVNPYTITYNLNGGAWGGVSHKDTYTKFDDGYDLPTPTKTDYTFLGWYENSEFTGDRVYILPAGSTGDKTYYAKWGSAVTATWDITDYEGGNDAFYKGGGRHHVKAVLNQADWDESGSAGALDLSASEGVTLSSVTKGVYTSGDNNGKAYVEAAFSISGDIDEDAIWFFLNVPAAGAYAAAELSKKLPLNNCPIVGGSPTIISIFDGTTDTEDTNSNTNNKYKQSTQFTNATTGFKYELHGIKSKLIDISEATYTGRGDYTRAIQWGGGSADYYAEFIVPTGYTASITITYVLTANSPKYIGFGTTKAAQANGSNYNINETISSNNVVGTSTFSSLSSGTYYYVCSGGTSFYILGVSATLTPTSGVPGVPTTLSWSESLADKAKVDKRNVDADFAYTATPSTNTIGAITYTSSDESVATVDGNGKVHIINAGPTTITATLAESGCYTGDEITYKLNVESTCTDARGTIVAADGSAIAGNSIEKGACETVTLKLTGYTDGATIQWQKDGANISGATSAEYTVPTDGAGVYTAVTRKNCDLTSNSVTVTSASSTIEPTIFADEFTVKDERPFEYRLMQLNEGETCTFESATKWKNDHDFEITTEGNIVTIKGYIGIKLNSNETIKLKISNGCSYIYKDIIIHATTESPKPMIAWIATGEKGVKDNVLADQSTNTALYKALEEKDKYALTPRNCYWTTDEKELIKEYSQYDLVILTDYPNSRKGPNSEDDRSKSYTNALGLLIDRVPMLTFEAFVAGCPNWGFSSNPKNTNSTQNSLTLLCNANDIFNPSNDFNAGASVEVGTAAEGQQALQGFELDAMPNFVFIAKITDGGRDYVTCCERQVNTTARMMVFGLNQNLMNAITETGEDMVAGFVKYLLVDENASIPDCSVIFKGREETGGTDWSNTSNWEGASLPNPYASVRIDAPCVVGDGVTAKAGMIKIHTGSEGGYTYTGSLTIQPQGRMIVENGVYRVEGTNYANYLPTEPNNLVINADAGHTGALIFSNPRRDTQATVYLYSKATTSEHTCWQYVGIPFGSLSPAVSWFYNAWMMKYTTGTITGDTELYSWEYINNYDVLNGFQGYALTQTAAKSYQLQGGLAPTTDKVLAVSNAGGNGWNLYANSWTAPIHIDKMEASDFVNADATIYLYNTGSRADWDGSTVDEAGTSTTAGQYLAVPVGLAEYTGTKYIPSMQGFFVQGNHASAAGSVRLRYDAVVRDTTVMADLNTPLRTPSRERVNQEPEHVTMVVRGEKYTDVLHLFRSDEWSAGYENGYDAHKVEGDDYTPQLYAVTGKEELAVVATDEWEGTVLNFRAGSEDVEYTIFFRYNESEAEALYLYDLTTETYTRIENGGSYHFSTTDKETHPRFILTYNAPSVATGTGDVQRDDVQSTKARKVLLDNHVYIFRNGKLYDSTGKMVK